MQKWMAWGLVLAGGGSSLMCGTPPQPPVEPQIPAVPDAGVSPPRSGATAEPAASARPASGATPLAVRSSTPGVIQCETMVCDAKTQVCCFDETTSQGRCLQRRPDGKDPCPRGAETRECDESSDCEEGTCCRVADFDDQCESIGGGWTCRGDGKCPTTDLSTEVCLPGSACGDRSCVASEHVVGWPREGLCPSSVNKVPCGSSRCGLGEACCYDPAAKRGTCVKDGEACEADATSGTRSLFWCTKRTDCDSDSECMNATGQAMYREFSCAERRCHFMGARLGPTLCTSKADCPDVSYGMEPDGTSTPYKLTGCNPSPLLPKGVRACEYQ
ncbi:MAG: hypothetical protein KC766_25385 [Myxococcales bacterium]|nr:hypothetical protein [Myxococcales bacterium]